MASPEVLFIHQRITIDEVIQAGFEEIAGWNQFRSNSVQSTLIQIIQHHPDLIILDFHAPEMDGVEILKMIRNYLCCYSPVVVFIAKPLTAKEEITLTELGVLKIIYKPHCSLPV